MEIFLLNAHLKMKMTNYTKAINNLICYLENIVCCENCHTNEIETPLEFVFRNVKRNELHAVFEFALFTFSLLNGSLIQIMEF